MWGGIDIVFFSFGLSLKLCSNPAACFRYGVVRRINWLNAKLYYEFINNSNFDFKETEKAEQKKTEAKQ